MQSSQLGALGRLVLEPHMESGGAYLISIVKIEFREQV